LVKRKRKTLANYIRNREVFERVTSEFEEAHSKEIT
jgi:hypothetical protein